MAIDADRIFHLVAGQAVLHIAAGFDSVAGPRIGGGSYRPVGRRMRKGLPGFGPVTSHAKAFLFVAVLALNFFEANVQWMGEKIVDRMGMAQ